MATDGTNTFQDSAADVIAIVVLIIVPVIAIAVFWLVHILPEKIAENRHHPQKDAIKVLCLLSLVFGGMLWPIAWLWAYSKPVLHKLAYGRDKHDDFYPEEKAEAVVAEPVPADTAALRAEIENLRVELHSLAEHGASTATLQPLEERLDTVANAVERSDAREARH
ncbi:MAG TPA: DUF3302 domain-containing protein [Steroidobacteraceae bacterium]|nr:DUF3302 domain-containing protein [Steroidobacteraceae bacterium]